MLVEAGGRDPGMSATMQDIDDVLGEIYKKKKKKRNQSGNSAEVSESSRN